MSTFAVFGMTRYYASQAALKNTPTTMIERGSNVLGGGVLFAPFRKLSGLSRSKRMPIGYLSQNAVCS